MTRTELTPVPESDSPVAGLPDTGTTEVPDGGMAWDIVDQWGEQSFPASDPPANW
jgi:hypothetical protein